MNFIERFKAWRERRYWAARHLVHIRAVVMTDWRWLCVHPAGKILTDRYEQITSRDWYKHPVEPIDALRRRLGWDKLAGGRVDNDGLKAALATATLVAKGQTPGVVYLEIEDVAKVEEHSWVGNAYFSKVPTSTNAAYLPAHGFDPRKPHLVAVAMDDAHHHVLVELAEKRGLSLSALMLQALRIYQAEDQCGAIAKHLAAQQAVDAPFDSAP